MTSSVAGKLLVCFLLLLVSGRIFTVKHARIDTLTVIAPLVFLIALLQIFVWGADVASLVLLLISFFNLLINLRALMRYSDHLYVDRYSVVFTLFSFLIFACTAIVSAFCIVSRPVKIVPAQFGVTEKTERMTGTVKENLVPAAPFRSASAVLYTYEPKAADKKARAAAEPVIIFLSDKRGDTEAYRPYLMLLASRGYTVMTGDFYTSDNKWFHSMLDLRMCRRFAMQVSWLSDRNNYAISKDYYTFHIVPEGAALVRLAEQRYGADRPLFIVGDGMADVACRDVAQKNARHVRGVFQLDSVPEYKSVGFGCVEQTDPFIASAVFGQKRDKTSFIARYLAMKTDGAVSPAQGVNKK